LFAAYSSQRTIKQTSTKNAKVDLFDDVFAFTG
jgi:hypothetical protein